MEGAKIHAENAIRQKNQALNYRRMSARIDAVASRVQTAVTTKQVTKSMGGVVKSMESAMRSMNLEQVGLLYKDNKKLIEYTITIYKKLTSSLFGHCSFFLIFFYELADQIFYQNCMLVSCIDIDLYVYGVMSKSCSSNGGNTASCHWIEGFCISMSRGISVLAFFSYACSTIQFL